MDLKKDQFLAGSILVAALLIAGAMVYTSGPAPTRQQGNASDSIGDVKLPVITEEDVILGDPNAPVTLVEFSDFQCPFCGRFFTQAGPQIIENYVKTGKVRMVYKHLAFLGPESTAAGEAVECAKDEGKFWAFHDEVFKREIVDGKENNGNLNKGLFMEIAEKIGLNVTSFEQCVDSRKYKSKVEGDVQEAQSILTRLSTPTVFINDTVIQGALPYEKFRDAIEEQLAR